MPSKIPLSFRRREDAWTEFAQRYAGNSFLDQDPLYPLPADLIDAIVEEAPHFFTDDEQEFERDLARLGRGAPNLDDHLADREQQLRELLVDELLKSGAIEGGLDVHFESEAKRRQEIERRVEAYAGWLVSNPQFRAERDELRLTWEEQVKAWGGFPSHPRSYLGEQPGSSGPRPDPAIRQPDWSEERWCEEVAKANAPFIAFLAFYRRWCLEGFETWDLPQPMWPELSGYTTHHTFTLAEAGVNAFWPWYLLRDQKFTLQDLAAHLKKTRNPAHLGGWLKKGTDKQGLVGYQRLYVIYRHWYLGIAARYPERILGNTAALDRAFATYLNLPGNSDTAAETIRKIRLELNKRLCPPTEGK